MCPLLTPPPLPSPPLPSPPLPVMLLHNLIRGLPQLLPSALLPALIAAISAEGPDEAVVPPHILPLYHDFRTAQVCVRGGGGGVLPHMLPLYHDFRTTEVEEGGGGQIV